MSDDYHVAEPVGAQPVQVDKASGMAIAALVLGILGFCCCGFITGVPALIIGWIENSKINRGESSQRGKGFAIAGIVLGIISVILACISLAMYGLYGAAFFTNMLHQMR
jgi:hypothetical protein